MCAMRVSFCLQIPFKFRLPSELPHTLEEGRHGSIVYTATAVVNQPGKKKLESLDEFFFVYSRQDGSAKVMCELCVPDMNQLSIAVTKLKLLTKLEPVLCALQQLFLYVVSGVRLPKGECCLRGRQAVLWQGEAHRGVRKAQQVYLSSRRHHQTCRGNQH